MQLGHKSDHIPAFFGFLNRYFTFDGRKLNQNKWEREMLTSPA